MPPASNWVVDMLYWAAMVIAAWLIIEALITFCRLFLNYITGRGN